MVLTQKGALAQLARASAWHAEGHRFEPDMLHSLKSCNSNELQDFLLFPFAGFFVLLLILLTDYRNTPIRFSR